MFQNYIKLAWRVLARRKAFSIISLFGISFTLGILMVTLSFLQSELGTDAPLTQKNDFVYLEQIRLAKTYFDTIPTIDTLYENGAAVYDTTFEYKETGTAMSQTEFNNNILQEYFSDLPSAKYSTMYCDNDLDVYVNGVKLSLELLLADANYWKVFDHPMLEGRTFDEQEVDDAAHVVVISTDTAEKYFGRKSGVIGEEMLIDGHNYKVIGLYEHKGKIIPYVSPDGVKPYTTYDLSSIDDFYFGPFETMFVKKPDASAKQLKDEIKAKGKLIPLDHPDNSFGFNDVVLFPATYNEMYAQGLYYEDKPEKSYGIMKWVLLGLLVFFTVLPTLNLINLNVSRIMERSSEIGVRKAFGAHQGNIVMQFIVENIVLTVLGGLIGFVLAWLLISIINNGGYLGKSVMEFNGKFFLYSLALVIMFGILSGLVPAYRMSRLQIVNALKENKL